MRANVFQNVNDASYGVLTQNEIRKLLGMAPIPELSESHPLNCKNCGAPLGKEKYCEYCGTRY